MKSQQNIPRLGIGARAWALKRNCPAHAFVIAQGANPFWVDSAVENEKLAYENARPNSNEFLSLIKEVLLSCDMHALELTIIDACS